MHYSKIALAATPVFAAYVSAYGSATVKNSCGDAVYFWSCGDSVGNRIVIQPGGSHTEQYFTKSGGGGPSLKIASSYSDGPKKGKAPESIFDQPEPQITQFEYTVGSPGPPANMVWYDISNINGYPFVAGGLSMTSSDGNVNVRCPKGVQFCQAAYNAPHDDHATGSAHEDADLTMELCSDEPGVMAGGGGDSGSGGSQGGSSGGSSSQPESTTAAPAPTQTPQQQTQQEHQQPSSPPAGGDGKPQEKFIKPAATPTPVHTEAPQQSPQGAPDHHNEDVIVYVTETAQPVMVTVRARAPEKQEKRNEHVHQHVHNKIHKKRHGN